MKSYVILKFTVVFALFLMAKQITAQSPFITTWDTSREGISNNNQISLFVEGSYNYYWEAKSDPSINGSGSHTDDLTITFPNSGIYELHVTPSGADPFHRFHFMGDSDTWKLIGVEQWGDVQWSSCQFMFFSTRNLHTIEASDVPDLSRVGSLRFMFSWSDVSYINRINEWDLSNVSSLEGMFYRAQGFNQDLSGWDTSNVENMSRLFSEMTFNGTLNTWDMSKVKTIYGMFGANWRFNKPLDMWDTSQITNMSAAFFEATSFNQPLDMWNTSQVIDMSGMFFGASSFNQPLSSWDVSKVRDMSTMFADSEFNQPIGNWDVGNVTDISVIFLRNPAFNQPLDNWDVSKVTNMRGAFLQAFSFNQPLNNWDVSNVKNMDQLFFLALSFNQPLHQWNLNSLENASHMVTGELGDSQYTCENYSRTLHGWANNPNTNSDVVFSVSSLEYSPNVIEYRDYLKNNLNWDMSGDELGTCDLVIGIEDNPGTEVFIYPNPSNGLIHISSLENISQIEVFDIYGKIVYRSDDNTAELHQTINLSRLSSGIYFMQLKTLDNGASITKKVVLE